MIDVFAASIAHALREHMDYGVVPKIAAPTGFVLWRGEDGAWFLLVRDRASPWRQWTPHAHGWLQLATRDVADAWQISQSLSALSRDEARAAIDDAREHFGDDVPADVAGEIAALRKAVGL